MEKVIIIREESHGTIGVAKDMYGAFVFLIEDNWINEDFMIVLNFCTDQEEWVSLEELMDRYECATVFEILLYLWEQDKDFLEGSFYFEEYKVYEYNPK